MSNDNERTRQTKQRAMLVNELEALLLDALGREFPLDGIRRPTRKLRTDEHDLVLMRLAERFIAMVRRSHGEYVDEQDAAHASTTAPEMTTANAITIEQLVRQGYYIDAARSTLRDFFTLFMAADELTDTWLVLPPQQSPAFALMLDRGWIERGWSSSEHATHYRLTEAGRAKLAEIALYRTQPKQSPVLCDHANETPRGLCKCSPDCSCRGVMCRPVLG